MSMEEFLSNCTAFGGNWGAMLLTGIKRVFPEYYTEVEEHYNSMDFSSGGINRLLTFVNGWKNMALQVNKSCMLSTKLNYGYFEGITKSVVVPFIMPIIIKIIIEKLIDK